jgi:hypothetical protein
VQAYRAAAGALVVACAAWTPLAQAQMECMSDPADHGLTMQMSKDNKSLEVRRPNSLISTGTVCIVSLDCTVRAKPTDMQFTVKPRQAGDPSSVSAITSIRFTFADGEPQQCGVKGTEQTRPTPLLLK